MRRSFRGKIPYMGVIMPRYVDDVGNVKIKTIPIGLYRGIYLAVRTHWQIEGYTGCLRRRHKDQIMR